MIEPVGIADRFGKVVAVFTFVKPLLTSRRRRAYNLRHAMKRPKGVNPPALANRCSGTGIAVAGRFYPVTQTPDNHTSIRWRPMPPGGINRVGPYRELPTMLPRRTVGP